MGVAASRVIQWAVPFVAVAVIAAGAAVAPAVASIGRSDPPPRSAAQLMAQLSASPTDAFSGSIRWHADLGVPSFGSTDDSSPTALLSGTHSIAAAVDGAGKVRIGIRGDLTENDFIRNGREVWSYRSTDRATTHLTLPDVSAAPAVLPDVTPERLAQSLVRSAPADTTLSTPGSRTVAGRAARVLRLTPTDADTLVGRVDIAVDAATGTALALTLTPRGSTEAALDVAFSALDLHKPPASHFSFTAPRGAKVQRLTLRLPAGGSAAGSPGAASPLGGLATLGGLGRAKNAVPQVRGTDWASIAVLPKGSIRAIGRAAGSSTSDGSGSQGSSNGRTESPRSSRDGSPAGGSRDGSSQKSGGASSFVRVLSRAATDVSGSFGHGKLLRTRVLTALALDDGRVLIGAVTPAALERAASTVASR